jgi:hypothetical protein
MRIFRQLGRSSGNGSGRRSTHPFLMIMILAIASLAATDSMAGSEDSLQVGTCQRDITPITPALAAAYEAKFGTLAVVNHTDPVYVAGFGNDRQATGYNDRLWARGVLLQRKDDRVGKDHIVTL